MHGVSGLESVLFLGLGFWACMLDSFVGAVVAPTGLSSRPFDSDAFAASCAASERIAMTVS